MKRKRVAIQTSPKGPAGFFAGTVPIDPLNAPPLRAHVACASVRFEPAARRAGHTHPLGRTVVATAGCGKVYRPDIVSILASLYKKPGCAM